MEGLNWLFLELSAINAREPLLISNVHATKPILPQYLQCVEKYTNILHVHLIHSNFPPILATCGSIIKTSTRKTDDDEQASKTG
jgi:hypothetical protein